MINYSFSFDFGVYDPKSKAYEVIKMPQVGIEDGWEVVGFRSFNYLVQVQGFKRRRARNIRENPSIPRRTRAAFSKAAKPGGEVIYTLYARSSEQESRIGSRELEYNIVVPKLASWVHDMQWKIFRERYSSPVLFSVTKLRRISLREKQEVHDLYGLREQAYWPEGSHPSRHIGYRR